jgi:hypothetical protein
MLKQLKQYVASTQGEGAMPAAQRISEALKIGLDEVLAAIQNLGPWGPAATLAGEGTVIIGAPAASVTAKAPGANQRKRGCVKRRSAVPALICGPGSCLGVFATAGAGARWLPWARGPWDLTEGMLRSRAGRGSCAARLRVPVTRVFSRYVVQAGSACSR